MTTREIFSPENPTIPACQVRASDIAEDLFVAPTVIEVEDDDTGNVFDEVSEVQPDTIGNSFSHNGWFQAFNNNDTSVLHTTLRELVEKNVIRGFQRRHCPEEVEAHNLNAQLAKEGMHLASDIDSDDEFEGEPDDFDFYRLQQDDLLAGRSTAAAKSLPSDDNQTT